MVLSLKLSKYKGIKEIEFAGLGKTNIICGRNSSGKSSILECIASVENRTVAKKIDIESLVEGLIYAAGQFVTETQEQILREAIVKCTNTIPLWYPELIDEISDELGRILDQNSEGSFSEIFATRRKVLLQHLAISPRSFLPILIPPKRQLINNVRLNHEDQLQPNGQGILNHLFFLKNQDIKSGWFIKYRQIYEAFKSITGHHFNIVLNKDNSLTLLYFNGLEWRSADDCGLGLSDALIIISVVLNTNSEFILIEEPETHLHADFQRKLLRFITNVSNAQFFISTHSNVFIDVNQVEKIFYSWFDKEVRVTDQTTPSKIISSLGYSVTENLTSDAIILTEGPKDIPIIQQLLKWIGAYDRYNVKLWPLGGDIMAELDLSIFSGRKNVFAIIDNDPGSSAVRRKFSKNCKDHDIHCYTLKRYAIESYFTLEAIRKVFGGQIDSATVFTNDKSIDEQIGFKQKGRSIKAKNYEIIGHMSLSDLKGTDLLQFIEDIKKHLDKNAESNELEKKTESIEQ